MLSDKTKCEIVNDDPILRNLSTVQHYISTLFNRGEITLEHKNEIRQKIAPIRRAHGLPNIHKQFESLPLFQPIVDTTNTSHRGVDKFLTNLLNSLTHNQYVVKDSVEIVKNICGILVSCLIKDINIIPLMRSPHSQTFL